MRLGLLQELVMKTAKFFSDNSENCVKKAGNTIKIFHISKTKSPENGKISLVKVK